MSAPPGGPPAVAAPGQAVPGQVAGAPRAPLPRSSGDAPDRDGGPDGGSILLRLGPSRYAVEMASVAEVVELPTMTRLPAAPDWLRGVANWRGRVLPVLDLRGLLATPRTPLPSSARLVVVIFEGVTVGLVAEAVPGVYDGPSTDQRPPPPTLTGEAALLVAAQLSDGLGPIAVLDVAAVHALSRRLDHRRRGS